MSVFCRAFADAVAVALSDLPRLGIPQSVVAAIALEFDEDAAGEQDASLSSTDVPAWARRNLQAIQSRRDFWIAGTELDVSLTGGLAANGRTVGVP